MDVETALREIDEATHKHVGGDYEEARAAYRATLEAVADLGDSDTVESVTRFVDGYIREHEERPAPAEVDERAAEQLREAGVDIPEDSRLADA